MGIDIDALRTDYRQVRAWWARHDGWSKEDISEADQAISDAVARQDEQMLACWKGYFEEIITLISTASKGTPEKVAARVMRTSNDL